MKSLGRLSALCTMTAFAAAAPVVGILCAPVATAAPYRSFYGATYDLTPREGKDVVVLTREPALDAAAMARIVDALDDAWAVYADLTARRPAPWPATTLNGRATIAEVPDGTTCGAACSYLGFNGTEITSTYWSILYDGVRLRNEYDQVLFYEFGRNFWFYGDQLGAIDPFVTGFAVANRFVSMETIGVAGGPFQELAFVDFERLLTVDLLAAYHAAPGLDWRNTIAIDAGVPGHRFSGAADLASAFLHRIYEDHGLDGYRDFYAALALQGVASTPRDAMNTFIRAAWVGTRTDYRALMKATDLPSPVPVPPAFPLLAGAFALLAAGAVRRRGPQPLTDGCQKVAARSASVTTP